jgi:hypothetical protein
MRQDQALTLQCLRKDGLYPSDTARRPSQAELRQLLDRAAQVAESEGDLTDVAINLAALVYHVNAIATLNGIDLEPFMDFEHASKVGDWGNVDLPRLEADVALMASVSEREQIQRLLDRDDLDATERVQVETCANLRRADIPLRWPQRVALARIESAVAARAERRALIPRLVPA